MNDENEASGGSELLLLTTERQVFAFNPAKRSRVTMGRHESNDVRLESRTVSNFHAEIICEAGTLTLRDLGSTNGTYVNDQRVESEDVDTGDRIRIGNHAISVELKQEDGELREGMHPRHADDLGVGSRGRIASSRARSSDPMQTVQTLELDALTVPDLLQRAAEAVQPLRIVLSYGPETARVWLRSGSIVHAENGRAVGEKALYRVFGWPGGAYEIESFDADEPVPQTIALPVNTLIMEGMAQAVELGKLVARLPPLESPLRLKEDCPLPVTAHSPAEIEMFQMIIRHETIGSTLESSTMADVRALKLIESLIEKGVFEAGASADAELEGTLLPQVPGKLA